MSAFINVNYFFNKVKKESTKDSISRYRLFMEGLSSRNEGVKVPNI